MDLNRDPTIFLFLIAAICSLFCARSLKLLLTGVTCFFCVPLARPLLLVPYGPSGLARESHISLLPSPVSCIFARPTTSWGALTCFIFWPTIIVLILGPCKPKPFGGVIRFPICMPVSLWKDLFRAEVINASVQRFLSHSMVANVGLTDGGMLTLI
jgi:hypothetical protein